MQESKDSSALFAGKLAQNYDKWYESPYGRYADKLEKELFLKLVDFEKGQSLLDVGCGTGHFSFWFHDLGFKVVGMDISTEMLKVARSKIKNEKIRFIQADAYDLPFPDNSFDLVVFITTLEFLSQPERALCEAFRVSREKIFLGVLGKWSFLALRRKLKALFKESIYREAKFYSVRELRELLRGCVSADRDDIEIRSGKTLRGAFIGLVIVKKDNRIRSGG